jgi:hypothetical protein
MSSIRIVQRKPERDIQYVCDNPLIKNRSPTDSLASFNNLASKESQILRRNPRVAKHDIVIYFLKVFDVPELKAMRDKVFGYLRKAGLNAVANIEPTEDGFGHPTDTVHFHILTDDERDKDFLRQLGRDACLAAGLQDKAMCNAPRNEFDVECRDIYDYDRYIDYFTKLDREEYVNLFIKKSRIQRFYTIGNWFSDANGNPRGKGDIWKEIKQETKERKCKMTIERLKQSERLIPMKNKVPKWEPPANQARLQEVLDKEYDETLYDWFSILLGQPTLFDTEPPDWLENIPRHSRKCHDLLDAIYDIIRNSENTDIVLALEHYHRL